MKYHLRKLDDNRDSPAACSGMARRPDNWIFNEVGFISHFAKEFECSKCKRILEERDARKVK